MTAAEANRSFSALLRRVREGKTVVVTSHGKPVARLGPVNEHDERAARGGRAALFARLRAQRALDVGPWTRDELYDD